MRVLGLWVLLGLCANASAAGSCGAGAGSQPGEDGQECVWDTDVQRFLDARQTKKATFAVFHSPSCMHCQRMLPSYHATANSFATSKASDSVVFAAIDATANRDLAASYEVTAYPTIFFFEAGEEVPIRYSGSRSHTAFTAFLNDKLQTSVEPPQMPDPFPAIAPSLVPDLTKTFESTLEQSKNVLVLWQSSSKQSDIVRQEFDRLAHWHSHNPSSPPPSPLSFGFIFAEERVDLVEKHKITSFPTVSCFAKENSEGEQRVKHYVPENKDIVVAMSAIKMSEWVRNECGVALSPKLPISATETCTSHVKSISEERDIFSLTETTGVLVEFYAPWCGHCKSFAPTFNHLSLFLSKPPFSEVSTAVRIDATKHSQIANHFNVKGYPTILWLPKGWGEANKQKFIEFENEKENEKEDQNENENEDENEKYDGVVNYEGEHSLGALLQFVIDKTAIKAPIPVVRSRVVDLTADTLDKVVLDQNRHVLILFYIPQCPHCKRALPEFDILAESFSFVPSTNITIARLDASVYKDAARKYGGTHRYPTVEFFPMGDKTAFVPWVYLGPVSADHVTAYLNEKLGEDVLLCGELGSSSGVVSAFEEPVRSAWKTKDFSKAIEEISQRTTLFTHSNSEIYQRALKKMANEGEATLEIDFNRLVSKLRNSKTLSANAKTNMTRRKNILAHLLSLRD